MNSPRLIARTCALAGLVGTAAAAAPIPAQEIAEAQLIATDRHFIDAFVADTAAVVELVDADFQFTDRSGAWLTRNDLLTSMREPRPHGTAWREDVRVRFYVAVALVHAVFSFVDESGDRVRIRYTNVYAWDGWAWRLSSAQHTSLKSDVGTRLRSAAAPVHAAWRGQDPTGDDFEVLRALNEDYVQAFRNADVGWYDAHLAPDFVVVFGDGSFHDRGAALADFAKPYFATHIKSFPVGMVSVDRIGDVAVIRAENAYELKDGRKGANRYTDVWVKRDGKWRCISAHITVHRAAA